MSETELMHLILFLVNIAMLAFILVFLAITPTLTRRSLLFGVRIPESAAPLPEVRALKRRFMILISVCGAVLLAALTVQYLAAPELSLLACLYFPLFMVAVQMPVFISCWRRALALKKACGWQVAHPATAETRSAAERGRRVPFPVGFYLLSIGLLLLGAVWSLAVYPDMPARIPTHWNFQMQPDAWADKSLLTVLAMPAVSIATVLILAVSNGVLYRTKLQVSAEDPRRSYAQHRMYRKMMSGALGILTICMSFFFFLLQLMSINVLVLSSTAMTIATGIMIAGALVPILYVSLKAGQSGNKLNPPAEYYSDPAPGTPPPKALPFDRGDDRYWKLGMFYYNPEDPALLVEDRFGTNSGLNYARPAAFVCAGILLAVTLAMYITMTVLFFTGGLF